MSCESNRELLELYALGLLDGEERAEVVEHLQRDCPNCVPALRNARALNMAILASLPVEEPSPGLRARVINSVKPAAPATRRSPLAWMAVAAGLAAATIWLGFENQQRSRQLAEAQSESRSVTARANELDRALAFLRDPQTRPAAARPGGAEPRGTYFVNPRSGVMLIASNLPIPAPGRAYEMWVIPKSGVPQPAGVFRPDPNGSAVHLQTGSVDLQAAQAFAITDEPEGGSQAPTTQPFLVTPAQGI